MEVHEITPAPLKLYNYKENIAPHVKLFNESLEAFKTEVIRIITRDFGTLPKQKSNLCKIHETESENGHEFYVFIEPETYRLSFEINYEGLIVIKLEQDYRNNQRDGAFFLPNMHWDGHDKIVEDHRKFLDEIRKELSAEEAYKMVSKIACYFKKHLRENIPA